MDAREFAEVVAITRTDDLLTFAGELGDILRNADRDNLTQEVIIAYGAAGIVHRELVIRHQYVDALDLFATANAVEPVLPEGLTYYAYVDMILGIMDAEEMGY